MSRTTTTFGGLYRTTAFGAILLVAAAMPEAARAQALSDIKPTEAPLTLASRGSFMVGGDTVAQTAVQLSSIFDTPPVNGGDVTINQMYVEYMVPQTAAGVSVVMLHGATLSGKTYDTTPDGRMGWYEHFVRQGHPVYVADQVSRGRSGVDLSVSNDVRAGAKPASELPNVFRISDQLGWTMFRFGPAYGTPFPDQQFPISAARAFSRQGIPDLNATLPTPNPNAQAMADLAVQVDGAVLVGHSESGAVPLDAALRNAAGIRGLILLEPGSCGAVTWSDAQVATFTKLPILAVFGDHLDTPTGTPGFSWQDSLTDCQTFVDRIQAAGGNARMLHLPEQGIKGNSHMMMMDRNNLQVADMLLAWIDENTKRP